MTPARDSGTPIGHTQRLVELWRAMAPEQRMAGVAALGLFASMFLRWYSKTDTLVVHGAAKATQTSLSAFQAFSFVEAAVLLVSAAVLAMLFARASGRAFQLPGGDGLVVMIAGGWAALLVFYRLLDKPGVQGNERVTATVGVEWGIFIALLLALSLVYAGGRMRARERPQAPLRRSRAHVDPDLALTVAEPSVRRQPRPARSPATRPPARPSPPTRPPAPPSPATHGRSERPRYPPAPHEQLSFEDQPTRSE